jgi:hypothetical protein
MIIQIITTYYRKKSDDETFGDQKLQRNTKPKRDLRVP